MARKFCWGGRWGLPVSVFCLFLIVSWLIGCGSTPPTPTPVPLATSTARVETRLVERTVEVEKTVLVPQPVITIVTNTVTVPVNFPVLQTVIVQPTRTYTQTVEVWMASWVAGALDGMGLKPWLAGHRVDEVDSDLVSSGWIGWYITAGKRPPFDWEWVTLSQMKTWLTPYPNKPDWLMDYKTPPGKDLIFFRYPKPPSGMDYLAVVPEYQVGDDGSILYESGKPLLWPESDDVLRQNRVLVALEPPKPDGFGCGNLKIFFPPALVTPTPTLTLTPLPGTTPTAPHTPTPIFPTATSAPPSPTPSRTPTVWTPSPTPTGVVICTGPTCTPVPTNTPQTRTPTPLPPASRTPTVPVVVPSRTPTGVVICGTPGNPPCPPVATNTPQVATPTPLPFASSTPVPPSTTAPTAVPPTAIPPTAIPPTAIPTAIYPTAIPPAKSPPPVPTSPPPVPTAIPPTAIPVPPTAVPRPSSTPAPR